MSGWALILAGGAVRSGIGHVRPMVGAVELPVGAVRGDDAHAKLSARALRWRIILIRAAIAFPGDVGVGDHL